MDQVVTAQPKPLGLRSVKGRRGHCLKNTTCMNNSARNIIYFKTIHCRSNNTLEFNIVLRRSRYNMRRYRDLESENAWTTILQSARCSVHWPCDSLFFVSLLSFLARLLPSSMHGCMLSSCCRVSCGAVCFFAVR